MPEITGSFWDFGMSESKNLTGAFSKDSYSAVRGLHDTSGSFSSPGIKFKASDSNEIYSKSETVQPPAICLIPQIKF